MKKAVFALVALVLLGGGIYLFYGPELHIRSGLPTPSKAVSTPHEDSSFCQPANLKALIELEGAAGNIYGILSIQNTSTGKCDIIGSNFVNVLSSARNLTTKRMGKKGQATFLLTPSQTVYSQIHFQSGPQCSGSTEQSTLTTTYNISPTASVTFQDLMNKSTQSITVCAKDTDSTQVDLWSLSPQPINQ
ncbi:MAG: DUF4232 domain-containing protein [Patescibacteria group bacterium]